ncbi:segregation and condensation protein A [Idiomarina sp. WRN-38]|uniref:segregation and condensation protein A n=1 Tax=unclassified Idiomarina TaxID=2614829 RepID=UPI0007338AC0|nr:MULTISPECIES: ScpA family protein [unclassified Idiomarina]KTG23287.1 segregation and condensation protein A [Idiomarina sp. H105]MBF37945.1 segregation/condensation protein A [Idiomarinaceae bacterium]OAE90680.1 segregation and condensation protein A [Idiomarina sp. WRN-38]WPZ00565.1 ScpA family protein [Idiomarina sp. OXR-189]|tara:strand:+ start:3041 stop:3856 length:816 start_codon:yes stop_codon:yes gene_type:complete
MAEQQSLPLGFVRGEPVIEKPEDLYIPPDALEVILDTFSGPMDLLLYLIRKQKLDIVDMPILTITRQYVEYVEMMKELKLELAADYLVMAAILAEIKSRLLLPKPPQEDDEEEDPRAELVRRLKEYEAIREGAEHIDSQPQVGRDILLSEVATDAREHVTTPPPEVTIEDLTLAFSRVLQQVELNAHHHIQREQLSTRQRMSQVIELLSEKKYVAFSQLFKRTEGRAGAVVSFLAILELVKESMIELSQVEPMSDIRISLRNRQQDESVTA